MHITEKHAVTTPMRIAMIGAGRVATSLTPALVAAGHDVLGVWSRRSTSAQRLAEAVGTQCWNTIEAVTNDADLYIISVSDNAVTDVAERLTVPDDAICVHTAGSLPVSALGRRANHGGVLYPMQTFSMNRVVDFANVSLFLEAADNETMTRLHALATTLGGPVYELSWDERRYLHLAAVFACNFSNHCYTLAEEILKRHHLPFDVMLPLVDETARKVHTMSPRDAQTGPAARGDDSVTQMQSALLADDTQLQAAYDLMTRSIASTANR